MNELLLTHGIRIPPDKANLFASHLLRARLDVLRTAENWAPGLEKPENDAENPTLRELLALWLEARKPVGSITRQHARALRSSFLALAIKTVTARKAFGSVGTVFKWASAEGYVDVLPFQGLSIAPDRAGTQDERRLPFTTADLKSISSAPHLASAPDPADAAARHERYWLPFLALTTAARVEELCGLRGEDVKESEEGIWYLDITPHVGRALKTGSSRRKIPLSSLVLDRGFPDYVQSVRGAQLWPHLPPAPNGMHSTTYVKWLGTFLRSVGVADKRKVGHSFPPYLDRRGPRGGDS